jgi:hypothetical protein
MNYISIQADAKNANQINTVVQVSKAIADGALRDHNRLRADADGLNIACAAILRDDGRWQLNDDDMGFVATREEAEAAMIAFIAADFGFKG